MEGDAPASSGGSCRSLGTHTSQDEVESVSSATSPSSQRTSASDNGLHNHLSKTMEVEAFTSDLGNYLPLGCLCFNDGGAAVEESKVDSWTDITHLPIVIPFDDALSSHIYRLAVAGWIRVFSARSKSDSGWLVFRLYILPFDVGLRFIDRQSKRLYTALESLLFEIDVSNTTWQGNYAPGTARKFDLWASSDEGSLFWKFSNIPSPAPSVRNFKEKYTREALEDLLDPITMLPGLKTQLYPYQCRSVGLMLQRETLSTLELDPRLERRNAPDGTEFYYSARDPLQFLRHPRYYEACKGGILAETMGLGKTLMCLALILATKDHPAKVPSPYDMPPVRPKTVSLADMAISAVNRKSVPWKVEFQRIKDASGDEMESCRARLEAEPASYEIPMEPGRWNRKTTLPPPKRYILASTTLIVVPRNLCKQWQSEIRKHTEEGALRMLIMDNSKIALPTADELVKYDIILFTRGRFEVEDKDGADARGRRLGDSTLKCQCFYKGATRIRDCHCIKRSDLYDSPLKHVHFKRLIIDEGHFFSNTSNTAVSVANNLVKADHRWVVSGTPAKDLGVEVSMSSAESLWHAADSRDSRDLALESRRYFSKNDDTSGAIKSLGSLASSFLRIKPWSAFDFGEPRADWEEYIFRHEDVRKRTFSGFSTCLRRVLESMVVKTQPQDVEIDLPPLSHEIVRLEPSFYDKLTANLFTLVLTANAVTSERTDVDYLFHKNSQKARSQLISNLRQSAFFWTGFSEADVLASLKSSNGYLKKADIACSPADRALLTRTLAFADTVLASDGWKTLARSHEAGIYVSDFPADWAQHWSFDGSTLPMLTGVSQLLEAQKFINERAGESDPSEGFAGAGIRAIAPAKYGTAKKDRHDKDKEERPILTKSGIPESSISGEPVLKRRGSSSSKGSIISPKKSPQSKQALKPQQKRRKSKSGNDSGAPDERTASVIDSATLPELEDHYKLPADSPFLKSRIVGTASAKLSYLISQVCRYHQDEKILIFYDGDNIAWYVAQALELLHIKHEIYAKSLAAHLKAEYVVRFDQEIQDRVLLMDVKNAAYGLNLPSASRIYFVNPVCRPNIEAQAIKRAHRIGQTRKVHVETLVLKGTIEEKMLERSKRMTRTEHRDANHLEDDGGIREIIQSAQIIPISEAEQSSAGQMAPLEVPQKLWGRPGWSRLSAPRRSRTMTTDNINGKRRLEPEAPDQASDEEGPPRKKVAVRSLAFVDCRDSEPSDPQGAHNAQDEESDGDDEPLFSHLQLAPSTTVPNAPLLSPSGEVSETPWMPLSDSPESPTIRKNTDSSSQFLVSASSPTRTSQLDASTQDYRRVSISQLLNVDTPLDHNSPLDYSQMLKDILQRL